MKSLQRDVIEFSAMTAFVLAFALAWGSPFVQAGGAPAPEQQPTSQRGSGSQAPAQAPTQTQTQTQSQTQAQTETPAQAQNQAPSQAQAPAQAQNQTRTGTFAGTIFRDGVDYVLKNPTGTVYKLDNANRARPFEGKAVTVTGELDERAAVLYVESIQSAEG
jgi:hypothetical protein